MKSFVAVSCALAALLSCVSSGNDVDYLHEWDTWKVKFNKKYDSPEEDRKRFEIFKTNVDRINAHNKEALSPNSNVHYTMKMNQFGDKTTAEYKDYARCASFENRKNGLKYSDEFLTKLESRNVKLVDLQNPGLRMDWDDLPNAVDWTLKDNIITPVKNQGDCGACWAFASTGDMESRYAIAHGELNSLSEQELIDCAGDDSNCNGGYSDTAFIYSMWNEGLSLETDYPYLGTDGHRCQKADYKHYDECDGLIEVERYNATALMAAVVQGPVTIGIEASEAFEYYSDGVFDGLCGTDVDHMVLVVGYNRTASTPYWKIKNSWGDDWGEDGYVNMCMDCDKNGESGECCIYCYPSVSYFY